MKSKLMKIQIRISGYCRHNKWIFFFILHIDYMFNYYLKLRVTIFNGNPPRKKIPENTHS